jgi:formylglycine-generating enzyme required for sulfatase activity
MNMSPLPSAASVVIFALFLFSVTACSTSPSTATLASAPPAYADLGDSWTRSIDDMVMVYVPAGSFEMGSVEGEIDEHPVHTVTLSGFWMDQTEVTNAQYQKCVKVGACLAPTTCDWGKPTYGDASKANHPVVCVDWHAARRYCEWTGTRLPTEAEWEYAARGPQAFAYPWGEAFDCSRGNFDDESWIHDYVVPGGEGCDGYQKTAPVGSFEAGSSWCGALDMAGNVSEWVADWHGDYSSATQTDPTGPAQGEFKVLRGGAWIAFQEGMQSTRRYRDIPDSRNRNGGFRCAASPPVP